MPVSRGAKQIAEILLVGYLCNLLNLIALDIMNNPRLTLTTTPRASYGENDELEVKVELRGTDFAGSTSLFDDHRQLNWLEESLRGFPRNVGEEVTFAMGLFSRLELKLRIDSMGRAVVESKLSTSATVTCNETLSVSFLADPAALDSFCSALRSFRPCVECEAILEGRQLE